MRCHCCDTTEDLTTTRDGTSLCGACNHSVTEALLEFDYEETIGEYTLLGIEEEHDDSTH